MLFILEEPDFDVQLAVLKLLTLVTQNCPSKLQDIFLSIPQALSRVVDLMSGNQNEVIRNEALLVLMNLTDTTNAEIKKIVTFEQTFEKLLGIIRDEGGTDGGIVVQDCLTVAQNLLRDMESNQLYFRESGCIGAIIPFLAISVEAGAAWSPQKLKNFTMLLELVQQLVSQRAVVGHRLQRVVVVVGSGSGARSTHAGCT